ncbi:MAG TPA: hypothetical protein EYN67_13325 [Flavobacteriales bacterium]|nr:hypothetical protein [Flavobacteriales bacterium]
MPEEPEFSFDIEDSEFSEDSTWEPSISRPNTRFAKFKNIAISLAVLISCGVVFFLVSGSSLSPYRISAIGDGISMLEIGSKVVVNGHAIGSVCDFSFSSGADSAVLELDEKLRNQLGKGSQFIVTSLNRWIPGNVGVVIDPVSPTSASDVIESGDSVLLVQPILSEVPLNGWLAVALFCVSTVLLVILFRILKKLIVLVLGCALLAYLAYHFNYSIDLQHLPFLN